MGVTSALFLLLISTTPFVRAQTDTSHARQRSCDSLSAPGHYPDYAPLPKYRIEREDIAVDKSRSYLLISLSPASASSETALTRVACDLTLKFGSASRLEVFFFDSAEPAKKFALWLRDQPHYGEYLWHFRALFRMDRQSESSLEYAQPIMGKDHFIELEKFRVILTLPKN
jgi:hypothetical protein